MATIVTLFKTRKPFLNTAVADHGLISFYKQRFATINRKLEQHIKDQLLDDPALGIYIDPKEPEVDLDTQAHTVRLSPIELAQRAYQQRQLDGNIQNSQTDKELQGANGATALDYMDKLALDPTDADTSGRRGFTPVSTADSAMTGGPNGQIRKAEVDTASAAKDLRARLAAKTAQSSTPADQPTGTSGLEGSLISQPTKAKPAEE